MFVLYADKNQLTSLKEEPVTSGSVNVYRARFEFSDDWAGLDKTAVFTAGCEEKSVLLDDNGECDIPWEVLTEPGRYLMAGVYGKRGGDLVLPTIWANLGMVKEGCIGGLNQGPPTPEIWQQELDRKGDRLGYTDDGELGLYSGGKLLSSAPVEGGGGEGGTAYKFGHGLKQDGITVSVDMADEENPDKTLPISAAAVETTVGNIEILLKTIRGV